VLFLAVAVLILYFKQVTEGYEDKERFLILQQVGMDDQQVKKTINRQVLWVFFLPLAATALHMAFASRIMARMLRTFMLYDWGLVLMTIGASLVVFALLYFGIYQITARTYYRIVRR
jgi:putative ABC transport system permease protein